MISKVAAQKTPDKLYAWMLSEPKAPRLIGAISRQSNGDVALSYDPQWIASGFALSEDMPISANSFTPAHRSGRRPAAPGALDDARPDRWGEKVIRYLYKPGATLFDHLYFAGDERFGAIGVSTSSSAYLPFSPRVLPRLDDANDLSDAARIIETGEGELAGQQRALIGAGGSLGGAKPKAVIAIDGEEWVLKFFNSEPVDHPLVEHATMTLARKAGINAAQTLPIRLQGAHAVAVKRFDRQGAVRVHCISACTLVRSETPQGMEPEFGYPQLARAMRRVADASTLDLQLRELFRRMIFNILIANTDDHEKNHALLCHISGRTMKLELSPAYDIVPTGSGALEHQFMISNTSREPSLADAMSAAADFNLTQPQAAKEVQGIIAVVNDWRTHFHATKVSKRDIAEIAALIDDPDLLEQRRAFTVESYLERSKPPRTPPRGAKGFR